MQLNHLRLQSYIIVALFWCCIFSPIVHAQSTNNTYLTLTMLQQMARERITAKYGDNLTATPFVSSTQKWLAGPLELQLTALNSNEAYGTDEYEISINANINSLATQNINKQISQLQRSLNITLAQAQLLFFSGITREVLWERLLAAQAVSGLEQKLDWINTYIKQLTEQVSANEASHYALLIAQQLHLAVQTELFSAEQKKQLTERRYHEVFGTQFLPSEFEEDTDTPPQLATHPSVRLAELQHELALNAHKLAASSASAWQLGLMLKHINTAGMSEQQLGISLGIPITLGKDYSVLTSTEWVLAEQAFRQESVARQASLQQQYNLADTTLRILNQQHAMLEQQVELGKQITQQLSLISQRNELEQSAWFNEIAKQLDLKNALEHSRLLCLQQQAKLHQIAGIPL